MLKTAIASAVSFLLMSACSVEKKDVSEPNNSADATARASSLVKFASLLDALKLTSDPADPSGYLEDEAMRTRLQTRFVGEAKASVCGDVEVVEKSLLGTTGRRLLLKMIRKTEGKIFYALVDVPTLTNAEKQPLFVYANSRTENILDEAENIFGAHSSVRVIPVLSNQSFAFGGKTYSEPAPTSAVISDVDLVYSTTLCVFNFADRINVDGRMLDEFLVASHSEFGGYKAVLAGAGTGAWIASLVAARTGAMLLSSEMAPTEFVHFDCGALVDPFYSLYAAESRLILNALVAGNTDETKYKDIPLVKDLRTGLFTKYRAGELKADDLAFELLARDAFATVPFSSLAYKNYSRASDDKGPHSGGLMIAHSRPHKAYPVNGSRIFANVFTSVAFKLADVSNGTHFYYREYGNERALSTMGDDYSLVTLRSKNDTVGSTISDLYVRPPSFIGESTPEYKWMIRGRAYDKSDVTTFSEQYRNFYAASCRATE